MDNKRSGYREHEHTADWELEVWAPDFSGLLEQAAQGMYSLSGTRLKSGPRIKRSIVLKGADPETLTVNFLAELLYLGEMKNLAFDGFVISSSKNQVQATISGAQIAHQDKEIKAVTYHNLTIRETRGGLEARIVFDV